MENIFKNENWKEIFLEEALDTSRQRVYVSDFGRVRIRNFDDNTFRLVDLELNKRGLYVFKYLDTTEDYKTQVVHRAVGSLFVKKKKPEDIFCVHKDYNHHNNHYKNLKWLDYEGLQDFHREKHYYYYEGKYHEMPTTLTEEQINEIKREVEDDASYPMLLKLATKYNLSTAQVSKIRLSHNWVQT